MLQERMKLKGWEWDDWGGSILTPTQSKAIEDALAAFDEVKVKGSTLTVRTSEGTKWQYRRVYSGI